MSGSRAAAICPEAGEDLWCLERNHAAEGDARVADLLEAADRCRVGGRAPSLRDAERLEPDLPGPAPSQEVSGEIQRESAGGIATVRPEDGAGRVGGRVEAEDDVVDGDSQVEAAFVVEVDDLIRGYGGISSSM